jgi:glycosyltransferase involved in cell wall biosynthesis
VEKMIRLLSDSSLRARLATAGRRTIEERYSLQVTAPQLVAVLSRVAGQVTAPTALTAQGTRL